MEDVDFVAGDQWKPEAIRQRAQANRPALTMNRLSVFTQQIINESRDREPALKITAADAPDEETQQVYRDTAEAIQQIIRQIEYESDANVAYDQTAEQQVISGRAYLRLKTEYERGSFRQKLCIKAIPNQFSVWFDPNAKEYDRSDALYCFVVEEMSRAEYKRRFPKQYETLREWESSPDTSLADWIGRGEQGAVRIAEYWVVDYKKRKLYLLPDGSVTAERDAKQFAVAEREEEYPVVTQYLIDGAQVIEKRPWLGSRIPIFPVFGKEIIVRGKRRTFSLIRPAKDPQTLVNVYASGIAEQIAAVPKMPYLVAEGQLAGRESEWQQASIVPKAFLQYKRFVNDIDMGVPQRETYEPPIQALSLGMAQAIDSIKATLGIFDASLGNESNEKSGVAIKARQAQTNIANFHFIDNQARSRKALGESILELLPIIYEDRQTLTGRTQDGKSIVYRLDGPTEDPETGRRLTVDLQRFKGQVTVSTGPSYTSQRQEALSVYSEVMRSDPNFFEYARDLFWKNVDAPGAERIAERAEKLLPPQLQRQQEIPPQAQQAMAQMEQQVQALVQTVEGLSEENEALKSKESIERERLQFEREKLIAQTRLEEMKLGSVEAIAQLKTELDWIKSQVQRSDAQAQAEEQRELMEQQAAEQPKQAEAPQV